MQVAKVLWGCHQIPERSFFFRGYQFPLCARCTGITFGYIMSFLLLILELLVPMWLCMLFLAPLIIDGSIQLIFTIMSNNIRRFTTGTLFGIGFTHLIANTIIFITAT